MSKTLNILILTNELRITCGVSSALYSFLSNVPTNSDINFYLGCGGGDAVDRFRPLVENLFVKDYLKHENRSLFNFLKSVLFVLVFCRRNKIDIIHSHTHYAANIAYLVAKVTGRKTVQSIHGLIPDFGVLPHYIADYFIAVNPHIIKRFNDTQNRALKKTILINNCINFTNEIPHKPTDSVRFILGSRLILSKGIDTFIQAVKQLPDEIRLKCDFSIAGEGKDETVFREMAKGTNIRFEGIIPDFENYLVDTHVFVIPSRSTAEGFPTSIMQAAKTGNLIMSSDFYGAREVLKHNYNSLIFAVDDANKLAEYIINYIEHPASYKDITINCFKDFSRIFNADKMVRLTIAKYRHLCGR